MDDLKLIDTKALASRLGKHVRTIRRWKKNGTLPAPLINDRRRCYWTESQLLNWLFAKEVTLADKRGHNQG